MDLYRYGPVPYSYVGGTEGPSGSTETLIMIGGRVMPVVIGHNYMGP